MLVCANRLVLAIGAVGVQPPLLLMLGVGTPVHAFAAEATLATLVFAVLRFPRLLPAVRGGVLRGGAAPGPFTVQSVSATRAPLSAKADPFRRLFEEGRDAVVLKLAQESPQQAGASEYVDKARARLEARTAIVPAGIVELARSLTPVGGYDEPVEVDTFLLDKVAVTNAMYQHFVDAGAYEDPELWPEEVLPHVVSFRDRTGDLGPRFWADGHFPQGTDHHPVVGVSWYEARAFADWMGQRLPTEYEWELAASWRLSGTPGISPRRYPWGDTMDCERCSMWSSHRAKSIPVDALPLGSAPNGVHQLVGNVWEWMDSDFALLTDCGHPIQTDHPAKIVRGGAYDTYFEGQCTSRFRTGLEALLRRDNVGLRCCLSIGDVPGLMDD